MTVGTFERIWPWLLFAGAGVLTLAVIRTWRRGWLKDEDGVVFHRKDHPRSFLVNDLLGVVSIGVMVYVGFGALNGWK